MNNELNGGDDVIPTNHFYHRDNLVNSATNATNNGYHSAYPHVRNNNRITSGGGGGGGSVGGVVGSGGGVGITGSGNCNAAIGGCQMKNVGVNNNYRFRSTPGIGQFMYG